MSSTLDRLHSAQRRLTKAAVRLMAGDQSAVVEAAEALQHVAGIVKELQTVVMDPGHGGPLGGGSKEELVLDKSELE